MIIRYGWRGPTRHAAVSVGLVATLLTAGLSIQLSSAATTSMQATVNFGSVIQRTAATNLGVGVSTYGATPLSSGIESSAEHQLDARYVRIPVGYRNGKVTSSAGGTDATLDVPALVKVYQAWGYRILVVCGGRTNDVDIQPGDATKIMQSLGFDNIDYTTPNEPGNQGKSVQDAIGWANMIYTEGRVLNPNFQVWGPVWAYNDPATLSTFATALGNRLGGTDFHHYAMGGSSESTAQAMSETQTFGQQVTALKQDLMSRGNNQPVNVDELNFSWRYNDGTPGGNNRFFTAVNTVWMTSAIGHILKAGGRALPYATQNGPLGMLVQAGTTNPDNRPASSPMPAYWGIANWTGASVWPHFKDSFYNATIDDPSGTNEVFAVNNEAGGYNVILINKSETTSQTVALNLAGVSSGSFTQYQNNPSAPYAQPGVVKTGAYDESTAIAVSLPPMTATVVLLKPGVPVAPPATTTTTFPKTSTTTTAKPADLSAPTNFVAAAQPDASQVVTSWSPPASGNTSITGYRISRNGTDSTGGGAYSTVVPATARSFKFTLLNRNTSYAFSVQAITKTGVGTVAVAVFDRHPNLGAPTNFTVTAQSDASQVVTSWSPPASGNTSITGYRISRNGTDSTGGGAYSTVVPATARSFKFTLLNRNTSYTFSVQAITKTGRSSEAQAMWSVS